MKFRRKSAPDQAPAVEDGADASGTDSDRVAQLVVQRFERAVFTEVEDLPESVRGVGGYGSTGVQTQETTH